MVITGTFLRDFSKEVAPAKLASAKVAPVAPAKVAILVFFYTFLFGEYS